MGEPPLSMADKSAEALGRAEVEMPVDVGERMNDQFWQINRQQIAESLQSMAPEATPQGLEQLIQKERDFTLQICQLIAAQFSKEQGKDAALMLFDIDETLTWAENTEKGTELLLRPSAPLVFEQVLKPYVQAKKMKVGILSNNPPKILAGYLKKGGLKPLAHTIDSHNIHSTYDVYHKKIKPEMAYILDPKAYIADHYLGDHAVVDPSSMTDGSYAPSQGDLDKLEGLQVIRRRHKGNIMVVDDMPYASHLNPNEGFYGRSLQDTRSQFQPN